MRGLLVGRLLPNYRPQDHEENVPRLSKRMLATDRQVQAANTSGEFKIKGVRNLVLRITAAGTKSWSYSYLSSPTGRWRKISLGSYPTVSLVEARDRALSLGGAVRQGKDPLESLLGEQVSFADLAKCFVEEARHRLKPSWCGELERILRADVVPVLGGLRASMVRRSDVALVVEKVASRGRYVAADRVLGIVRAVFNWANATGRLEGNPTTGLKKRNTSRPRSRVLDDDEIRLFWRLLKESKISVEVCDALRLQLLLGLRISEAMGTAKNEIDIGTGVWTIPAGRTKSRRSHVLPLPELACSILEAALARSRSDVWLFPSPSRRPNETEVSNACAHPFACPDEGPSRSGHP